MDGGWAPDFLAGLAAAFAAVGVGQGLVGWLCVARFMARASTAPAICPPITVLKPLHGDEPLLEAALASLCQQDYPAFQIVFGVQDANDAAIAVVERLRVRFPACRIALVVDPAQHGPNRKIGNLMNMLPTALYDVLAIADSDLHVQPEYLRRLAAVLDEPGVGLVTTLYAGLPANASLAAALGATQITHGFLPGALLARALGRQDCLGATMCLRRETLARIGGLDALVSHLADDNVLGSLVRAQGLTVRLAATVPLTTVPETTLRALFRHEVRWARTIRALAPIAYAASVLQYALFWAGIAIVASLGAAWSIGLLGIVWLLRASIGAGIDRALAAHLLRHGLPGLEFSCPVWLLPLRDAFSVMVFVAGHAGRRVEWRGHGLYADTPPTRRRSAEGISPP